MRRAGSQRILLRSQTTWRSTSLMTTELLSFFSPLVPPSGGKFDLFRFYYQFFYTLFRLACQ
jgi:hypothetical protein